MGTIHIDSDAEAEAEFAGILGDLTALAEERERSQSAVGGSLAEITAGWLTPRYLLALRGNLASQPVGPERFRLLQEAVSQVVALERGDAWMARLRLDRERLEFHRQIHKDRMTAEAAKLLAETGTGDQKQLDPNRPLSDAEMKALVDQVDEIFGLKPMTKHE